MGENNQLVKTDLNIEQWADNFSKSNLCPKHLKNKPLDIVLTAQLGNDLEITRMTAMSNVYIIDEKPTLSVHLYKALLLRGGVTWKIQKVAEPMYSYKDTTGNSYTTEELKDTDVFKVFPFSSDNLPKGFQENVAPTYKDKILVFKSKAPFNYITQIEFTRPSNGMVITQEFYYKDAKDAGYLEGSNANWTKRYKNMSLARCFTEGARNIAPDLVFNMYHRDEILDETKKEYVAEDLDIAESTVVESTTN